MRPRFRMTIGPDLGEAARANTALAAFVDTHGVPASIRRGLSVALDELLTNTITHGFAGRKDGELAIEVDLGADRVSVTLSDDGPAFNPLGAPVPDTALPMDTRQIGGLGIHLVRALMDDVGYERRGERNVVTLTKRLSGGTPGA